MVTTPDRVEGDFTDWVVSQYRLRGCFRPDRGGTHDTVSRLPGGGRKVVTWDRRGPRERITVRVTPEPPRPTSPVRAIRRATRIRTPRGRTPRRQRSTTAGRDDGDDGPGEPSGLTSSRRAAALELYPQPRWTLGPWVALTAWALMIAGTILAVAS